MGYVALKAMAKELKLSADCLRNWCNRGLITYSKLPGAVNALWMVDQESVERLMKKYEVAATVSLEEAVKEIKRGPGRPPIFKAVK